MAPITIQKTETGISSLDKLLGGGLPPRTNLLFYGGPMTGKKPLLMQFIYEGLKMGTPGIFVLTDHSYDDWKKMMLQSGFILSPYEQKKVLKVIDCYSRQFDPDIKETDIISYPETPSAINSISLYLTNAEADLSKKKDTHRIAFHSLSSLLEATSPQTAFRFLQFMIGKFRKANATCVYALEKGMHDEKDVAMIMHLMDGLVEFEGGKLRANGIIGADRNWHPYTIGEKGFEIEFK